MKTTLTIISVILLIAGTVKAQLVMYIPTSLPSSQGWIYTYDPSTANPAESDIFSIAGSTLWQNSMGIGNIEIILQLILHSLIILIYKQESYRSINRPIRMAFVLGRRSVITGMYLGSHLLQSIIITELLPSLSPLWIILCFIITTLT